MTDAERKKAAAEAARMSAGPGAGTVTGRAGPRPGYVGLQHSMRAADGPKARTLPGLNDVMKDLAVRGGLEQAGKAEAEHDKGAVRQYNQTHRQGVAEAARRRVRDAAAAAAEEARDDTGKAPKSISSRSMQLADRGSHGPKKNKPVPDRELKLPGSSGRAIEETAVDLMQGGKSGLSDRLEAMARAKAKRKNG